MPQLTAAAIAALVNGEVRGDPERVIARLASLETATSEALTFIARARYLPYLHATRAGAALVTDDWVGELPAGCTGIVVSDPQVAMQTVLARLHAHEPPVAGIHPTAIVAESARIGAGVAIGPYAVIGEGTTIGDRVAIASHVVIGARCTVGDETVIHPQVTLYDDVVLGDRVILHSGVRLGSDGFGYAWNDGGLRKIPQIGGCVIGSDVEIGANTAIDRGSVGSTEIGEGSKLDNLVHIGHNVRIGKHAALAGQVGIAGSSTIEDGVVFGGQAAVAGHLRIGAGARIAGKAGVTTHVPAGATYSGFPARPNREALRAQAGIFRLPDLIRRLRRLEARIFGSAGDGSIDDRQESAPAE